MGAAVATSTETGNANGGGGDDAGPGQQGLPQTSSDSSNSGSGGGASSDLWEMTQCDSICNKCMSDSVLEGTECAPADGTGDAARTYCHAVKGPEQSTYQFWFGSQDDLVSTIASSANYPSNTRNFDDYEYWRCSYRSVSAQQEAHNDRCRCESSRLTSTVMR